MMSLKLEMLKKKKSVLNYVKSFSYLLKCNPRNFACKIHFACKIAFLGQEYFLHIASLHYYIECCRFHHF